MTIEDDIITFKMWASKMGCPLNCIPTDEALNSLFRSRQSSLLFNIMERVRPRDEVETIRKNIFISRMKKISEKTLKKYERGFGPREYQRYCEIQDLENEKLCLEFKIKEVEERCDLDMLKSKILQKEKLICILNDLEVKCNILELKSEDLDSKVATEEKLKEKIIKLIPAKLTSLNMNEENTEKAIADALSELDEFYNICLTSSNSHYIEEAKEQLWSKLRNIFLKIPNSSLWNVLMRMKEEQLQKIKDLNYITDNKENNKFEDFEDLSDFDLQLIKTKSSILTLVSNYISIKREQNYWKEKFASNYNKFCKEIQSKVFEFGAQDLNDEDEILSDFLVQYNTYSYNKGQKNFLISEIERCKKLVEKNNRALEDHEILLGSLKQMYSEIETNVKRTQNEVVLLSEIKDKIKYSKILLQHLVTDIQSARYQIANKAQANFSGESSLNMTISTDTLKLTPPGPGLCSTKLDMDVNNSTFIGNTTFRGNISVMINQNHGVSSLPQYTNELVLFKDIPITKFEVIPKECQFIILKGSLENELSDPTILLRHWPTFLLRPEIALLKLKTKFEWYNQLNSLNTDIRMEFHLPEINEANIKDKLSEQHEEVMRLLDEIKEIGINSERLLTKSQKYYNFLKENPLKQFIPASKLVNNQTYADYDAEYNMYYRMITSSNNNR